LEWRGPDSNNNGSIRFSVRQAAEALGVAIDTAARAFHDLQAKGFIIMKEPAVLGLEGAAKSPAFELTELGGRDGLGPRKLYMQWTEGCDFPVLKAAANNPTGRTRKAKPCPKNHDGTVLEFRTERR
jgi:DNA-binding transcriptional MocR family regulator